MKHRFVFSLFVFVASLFVFTLPLFAAPGPADYYAVTITKLELYNGTSWVTVFEGTSSELDIASVSSGASAGNFFSGAVPDGTYTQVRVTPSPTFKIRGRDSLNNYTTATNGSGGGSTLTTDINLKATCTITLTGGNVPTAQTQDFTATPITVTDGVANRKVRVSFDVSAAVQLLSGELWPAAPAVTMTVQ